ncbi:uncharacterized protein LOC5510066 [Nematostella vectensis]|uniref:uncharacterized protein LOC5510066 n=1 Tax=Nematostella vectensis TaxID=45351 RepID=UPI0020777540|nr:uncharacterized protein LOC5510066 [Nematostella vectensis]
MILTSRFHTKPRFPRLMMEFTSERRIHGQGILGSFCRFPARQSTLAIVGTLIVCTWLLSQRLSCNPDPEYSKERNKRDTTSDRIEQTHRATPPVSTATPIDPSIFEYIEEPPAGNGTSAEEWARLRHFLSVQGTVCEDVRRCGGAKAQLSLSSSRTWGPDGAWDVCFDKDAGLTEWHCTVYSFGISDDFSFDDCLGEYGCHVYSFDPTNGMEEHRRSDGVYFYDTGLSTTDQERTNGSEYDRQDKDMWRARTLASIVKELNHTKRLIDVVKIDIEWDEWNCLPQMLADGTLRRHARQLVIELHCSDKDPSALRKYYSTIRWLQRQSFEVASMHKNPTNGDCFEMLFINTRIRKRRRLKLLKKRAKQGKPAIL